MTQDQFMKLHDERKQRNIDPFELQAFQEEQSASLKEYENLVQRDRAEKELETMSRTGGAYKGFSQQKNNKKPKKRQFTSLPRNIE